MKKLTRLQAQSDKEYFMKTIFVTIAIVVFVANPTDDNYLQRVVAEKNSTDLRHSLHGTYAFARLLVEHQTDHEFCSRYFFCELTNKINIEIPDAWKQNLSMRFAKGKFTPKFKPADIIQLDADRGIVTSSGVYELPNTGPAIRRPFFTCETENRLFAIGVLETGFSNLLVYDRNSKMLLHQAPLTATEKETYNLPPSNIANAADVEMQFDTNAGRLYIFWIGHNDMGIDTVDIAKMQTTILFQTSDTLSNATKVQKNSN